MRSRWWKRNCIESCPIKSSSGFSRHLVRFSGLHLSLSKVKLQLKVSSEVLPPSFHQQLCSVYPIVIQFKNLIKITFPFYWGLRERTLSHMLVEAVNCGRHKDSFLLGIWNMPGFNPHSIPKSVIISSKSPVSLI